MVTPLHYWDSCTFLAYLKAEADKVDDCVTVLKHAENGNIKIVTSSLTLVEVIKLKKREPISREDEERIRRFFMHKWLILQDQYSGQNLSRILASNPDSTVDRILLSKSGVELTLKK